jgi:excisionase family DNA binding protein
MDLVFGEEVAGLPNRVVGQGKSLGQRRKRMRTTKTQKRFGEPVVLDFYRGERKDSLQAHKALYDNSSKIYGMTRGDTIPLQRLRQAMRAQRQAFEQLEESLLEFSKTNRRVLEQLEESLLELEFDTTLDEERSEYSQQGEELLSIPEVRQRLGMGKSWVYQRLKSGEIPSVRLGNNFKVKRQDLEEYIRKNQHNQAAG